MLTKLTYTVVALASMAGSALAQSTAQPIDMDAAAKAPPRTRMDKDVTSLMALWPGDYDNREQVQIDTDMGRTAPNVAHVRVHSAVRQINAAQIGPHILSVEDYAGDDTAKIIRRGLYEVLPDNDGKTLRVKVYTFKDPTKLDALTRADIVESLGCEITLRRDGDTFAGGTNPATCRPAKNQSLDYQVKLAADEVLLRERTLHAKTGEPIAEFGNFAWHQLERARFFSCMIDPPRSMRKLDDNGLVKGASVVRIHDQGGTYTFPYADGRTLFMSLRNTWSYNMNRKTLVVTLQENNEKGAGLGYAWSEPGADRLGMNPLWIHIQCDLDTPENLEMQRSMRSVL